MSSFSNFFVETDGWSRIILKCFSLRQSYQSLVETSVESQNPVYFLKLIMMLFVVMGHRWLFSLCFPLFQTEELELVSQFFTLSMKKALYKLTKGVEGYQCFFKRFVTSLIKNEVFAKFRYIIASVYIYL